MSLIKKLGLSSLFLSRRMYLCKLYKLHG